MPGVDRPAAALTDDRHRRRPVILALIAALLLVVGLVVFIRSRQTSTGGISADVKAGAYPVLIPDLCASREAAAKGDRTGAYNLFYARSHQSIHILVADLLDRDRPLAGRIQRAMSVVEQDLTTFSPSIDSHMGPLIAASADGLREVKAEVPLTCVQE